MKNRYFVLNSWTEGYVDVVGEHVADKVARSMCRLGVDGNVSIVDMDGVIQWNAVCKADGTWKYKICSWLFRTYQFHWRRASNPFMKRLAARAKRERDLKERAKVA